MQINNQWMFITILTALLKQCVGVSRACVPLECPLFCLQGLLLDPESACEICKCRPVTCSQVECAMTCQHGFSKDSAGCDLCQCRDFECEAVTCMPGKVCEVYSSDEESEHAERIARCVAPGLSDRCKQPMERGTCSGNSLRWYYDTEYDDCHEFMYSGCHGNDNQFESLIDCKTTCRPAHPDYKAGCSPISCFMMCEHGFQEDMHGCPVCKCKEKKSQPTGRALSSDRCPHNACREGTQCTFGYERDDVGCQTCNCHMPPHCSPINCKNICPHGRLLNEIGCETCQCREAGAQCSELRCLMHCPYGWKQDMFGCPHCECRDDPCMLINCPPNTYCKLNEETSVAEAVCAMADTYEGWCMDTSCMMYCEHGFKTDTEGCSICECRDSSSKCWREHPCDIPCHFGYAFNSQGCNTCDCLDSPCLSKSCTDVQVCEVTKICPAISCKNEGSCIDKSLIRRVHIDMILVHSPVKNLDKTEFLRQFIHHISDLLGVNENQIHEARLSRKDNGTLVVDFHLLADGEHDLVEEMKEFKHHLEIDMGDATLQYGKVQFVPQPERLQAMYHSSMIASHDNASYSRSIASTATVVIIAVAVGALMLIALLALIIGKIMQKKNSDSRRKNIIYKKATTDVDTNGVDRRDTNGVRDRAYSGMVLEPYA